VISTTKELPERDSGARIAPSPSTV
jgi:hypothetical protein